MTNLNAGKQKLFEKIAILDMISKQSDLAYSTDSNVRQFIKNN